MANNSSNVQTPNSEEVNVGESPLDHHMKTMLRHIHDLQTDCHDFITKPNADQSRSPDDFINVLYATDNICDVLETRDTLGVYLWGSKLNHLFDPVYKIFWLKVFFVILAITGYSSAIVSFCGIVPYITAPVSLMVIPPCLALYSYLNLSLFKKLCAYFNTRYLIIM